MKGKKRRISQRSNKYTGFWQQQATETKGCHDRNYAINYAFCSFKKRRSFSLQAKKIS